MYMVGEGGVYSVHGRGRWGVQCTLTNELLMPKGYHLASITSIYSSRQLPDYNSNWNNIYLAKCDLCGCDPMPWDSRA